MPLAMLAIRLPLLRVSKTGKLPIHKIPNHSRSLMLTTTIKLLLRKQHNNSPLSKLVFLLPQSKWTLLQLKTLTNKQQLRQSSRNYKQVLKTTMVSSKMEKDKINSVLTRWLLCRLCMCETWTIRLKLMVSAFFIISLKRRISLFLFFKQITRRPLRTFSPRRFFVLLEIRFALFHLFG